MKEEKTTQSTFRSDGKSSQCAPTARGTIFIFKNKSSISERKFLDILNLTDRNIVNITIKSA